LTRLLAAQLYVVYFVLQTLRYLRLYVKHKRKLTNSLWLACGQRIQSYNVLTLAELNRSSNRSQCAANERFTDDCRKWNEVACLCENDEAALHFRGVEILCNITSVSYDAFFQCILRKWKLLASCMQSCNAF